MQKCKLLNAHINFVHQQFLIRGGCKKTKRVRFDDGLLIKPKERGGDTEKLTKPHLTNGDFKSNLFNGE